MIRHGRQVERVMAQPQRGQVEEQDAQVVPQEEHVLHALPRPFEQQPHELL